MPDGKIFVETTLPETLHTQKQLCSDRRPKVCYAWSPDSRLGADDTSLDREFNYKAGSLALFALDRNQALVILDGFQHKGQSQSGAVCLGTEKGIINVFNCFA